MAYASIHVGSRFLFLRRLHFDIDFANGYNHCQFVVFLFTGCSMPCSVVIPIVNFIHSLEFILTSTGAICTDVVCQVAACSNGSIFFSIVDWFRHGCHLHMCHLTICCLFKQLRILFQHCRLVLQTASIVVSLLFIFQCGCSMLGSAVAVATDTFASLFQVSPSAWMSSAQV